MKYMGVFIAGMTGLMLSACDFQKEENDGNKVKPSIENEANNDFHTHSRAAADMFFKLQEKDTSLIDYRADHYRIDIGDLLNDHRRYALLAYFTSDTTGKVIINEKTNNGWINLFDEEFDMYHYLNDLRYLRFEDFTGDGRKEILIPYNLAPSHENFNYYCLKRLGNEFRIVPKFEALTHPEFDPKNKTIHTLHGGGFGNYVAGEYKLEDFNMQQIKEVNSASVPSEKSPDGYMQVMRTFRIQKGKPYLTRVDTILGLNALLPPFWEAHFE